ncbi:hypothetical protein [Rhodococcus ruber]|nr:hypothetical protein [Rhodococcus ruber]
MPAAHTNPDQANARIDAPEAELTATTDAAVNPQLVNRGGPRG